MDSANNVRPVASSEKTGVIETEKRKRGRPKGSKNKRKTAETN